MAEVPYSWAVDKMVEVTLRAPDDFLKVRETLTRMGLVSKRPAETGKQVLTQSCHLLHKKGRYYIMHFKELFCLDGRSSDLSVADVERRNLIISLLQDWELLTTVQTEANIANSRTLAPISAVRVIAHKEKDQFELRQKYQVGTRKPLPQIC